MGFLKDLWDGGASSAAAKQKKQSAKNDAEIENQYGFGLGKLLAGLKSVTDAKIAADLALSDSGHSASVAILENQEKVLASTNQDLVSMGLSGSTVKSNAAAQIAKGTSAEIAKLNEGIGTQKAGLEFDFAAAENNALQGISNFAMNKAKTKVGIAPVFQAQGGGLAGEAGKALGQWVGGQIPGAADSLLSLFKGSK